MNVRERRLAHVSRGLHHPAISTRSPVGLSPPSSCAAALSLISRSACMRLSCADQRCSIRWRTPSGKSDAPILNPQVQVTIRIQRFHAGGSLIARAIARLARKLSYAPRAQERGIMRTENVRAFRSIQKVRVARSEPRRKNVFVCAQLARCVDLSIQRVCFSIA